jgi:Zn-dependent protease with chaperone function
MNRRGFLRAAAGCGGCLLTAALYAQSEWQSPPRLTRPDIATDEGGLWAMMDREEARLRRSPFVIRDTALREYVQGIACKLAGPHCPDVRVHLVNTPIFNAFMAPNGMMQVWSGLLLRVENEAQLAAILGHEIGHYLQRHSLERLRDARTRSAFGQFLGVFGLVGAIGQLAVLASMMAYSREQGPRPTASASPSCAKPATTAGKRRACGRT